MVIDQKDENGYAAFFKTFPMCQVYQGSTYRLVEQFAGQQLAGGLKRRITEFIRLV